MLPEPADRTLKIRVTSPENVGQGRDKNYTTYRDVRNYLLETFSFDDGIVEAEGNCRRLLHTPLMSPADYAVLLSKLVVRCILVHSESSMLVIFIEVLHESILGADRTHWSKNQMNEIKKLG